jgi:hypothetical protein
MKWRDPNQHPKKSHSIINYPSILLIIQFTIESTISVKIWKLWKFGKFYDWLFHWETKGNVKKRFLFFLFCYWVWSTESKNYHSSLKIYYRNGNYDIEYHSTIYSATSGKQFPFWKLFIEEIFHRVSQKAH